MEEKVGYQPEESVTPFALEGDWRWQESVNMAPDAIMDELLGLSEEVRSVKTEWEGVRFELRQAQERLKLMEAQVLQAALDSEDKDVAGQVAGKNAEVRKRKADVYLADHPAIEQLASEIKDAEGLEIDTRLAMEALLDHSKNLHQWARMFEAQVRLLSTVRMPEEGKTVTVKGGGLTIVGVPVGEVAEVKARLAELDGVPVTVEREPIESKPEEVAHILARAYREPFLADSLPEAADTRVIFAFAEQPKSLVHTANSLVWADAQKWMRWYANPVGSPPVDTVELIDRIVEVRKGPVLEGDVLAAMTAGGVKVPVETSYVGEEPEPDGARFASEVDELFPPDVQIPPSMDVSEAEVDDMKAAMDRYLPGKKADESPGPSL